MIGANPLWLTRRGGFTPQLVALSASASLAPSGFTRSGPVWVPDASGVLQPFGTDVPAREYHAGEWGYWTHPQFTVGLLGANSHNLTSTGWTPNGLTVATDATAPAAGESSSWVAETAAFGLHRMRVFSSATAAIGDVMRVSAVFGPRTNRAVRLESPWGVGVFTYPATATVESGYVVITTTALGAGWVRVDMLVTATTAVTYPVLYLHSVPPGGIIGDVNFGFHTYAVNLSLDRLSGAPLVKVATGVTTVVVGEARWRGTLTGLGMPTVGAFGVTAFVKSLTTASAHIIRIDDNSETNRVLLYRPPTSTAVLMVAGDHIETGPSASGAFKVATRVSADAGARAAMNGAMMTVSAGTTANPGGLSHWALGGGVGSGLGAALLLRRAWFHPTAVGDAELTQETTL